jgi:predicted RNase H-like HicB family nuclease
MHNEFTAVFERDDEWVIAYCPEIPGANGQGRTKDEARESLRQAIALILEDAAKRACVPCRRMPNRRRWS